MTRRAEQNLGEALAHLLGGEQSRHREDRALDRLEELVHLDHQEKKPDIPPAPDWDKLAEEYRHKAWLRDKPRRKRRRRAKRLRAVRRAVRMMKETISGPPNDVLTPHQRNRLRRLLDHAHTLAKINSPYGRSDYERQTWTYTLEATLADAFTLGDAAFLLEGITHAVYKQRPAFIYCGACCRIVCASEGPTSWVDPVEVRL